ncbi:MAG: hypothetical protein JNJ73_18085 [Hyphomonadaceae bacterium]|nr:hypothetical protein [Hyphomonadaceae bacterium]
MDFGLHTLTVTLATMAFCFVMLFFIVPLFPGDGREAERLAQWERERQEREAASKAAE